MAPIKLSWTAKYEYVDKQAIEQAKADGDITVAEYNEMVAFVDGMGLTYDSLQGRYEGLYLTPDPPLTGWFVFAGPAP